MRGVAAVEELLFKGNAVILPTLHQCPPVLLFYRVIAGAVTLVAGCV